MGGESVNVVSFDEQLLLTLVTSVINRCSMAISSIKERVSEKEAGFSISVNQCNTSFSNIKMTNYFFFLQLPIRCFDFPKH